MDNIITYRKNGDILWIRLYKQFQRKNRFESHRTFLQDCLANEVSDSKRIQFKMDAKLSIQWWR